MRMMAWLGILFLLIVVAFHNEVQANSRNTTSSSSSSSSSSPSNCSILFLLPFSGFEYVNYEAASIQDAKDGYSLMAAADLAVRHFNKHSGAVVPELPMLLRECPNVTLSTYQIVDSKKEKYSAVEVLVQALDDHRSGSLWASTSSSSSSSSSSSNATTTTITSCGEQEQQHQDQLQSTPCAMLGPKTAEGLQLTNAIAYAYDITQVSYAFATPRKMQKEHGEKPPPPSPLSSTSTSSTQKPRPRAFLASIMPQSQQVMNGLLHFLLQLSHGQNEHLAVLYDNKPESLMPADGVAQAGLDLNFSVQLFSSPSIREGLLDVRQSGVRTIFVLTFLASELVELAKAAGELGMLEGNDYRFILNHEATGIRHIGDTFGPQIPGSPMDKLLSGALLISYMDGFAVPQQEQQPQQGTKEDRFLTAWRAQGPAQVEQLNIQIKPIQVPFHGEPDYFQTEMPAELSSFVYDSVIAIGLGACQASRSSTSTTTEASSTAPAPSAGAISPTPSQQGAEDHHRQNQVGGMTPLQQGITQSAFQGASGRVDLEGTDSRMTPAYLGVYNVRAVLNSTSFQNSYEAVLIAYTLQGGTAQNDDQLPPASASSSIFSRIPGEEFVYRTGSTEPPALYKDIGEQNFLSQGVRVFGFTMMGLCWLVCIGAIFLLVQWRDRRTVRMGQPIFLILLCVGSIVLSSSILTMSFDENAGWSERQLDHACAWTAWLFFIGHVVTLAAIACKLWRLDKVLQMRRRKVTAIQAMGPLVIFLAITITLLIVWTAVDPWQWEREIVDADSGESYGRCTSDHFWAFSAPLMALLVTAEAIAGFFAYRTMYAPGELSEASPVFYAIVVHLQSWAMGVPILAVIGDSSANATYVGRVALIWVFAISSVIVVVLPKLWRVVVSPKPRPSTRLDEMLSKTRVFVSGVNFGEVVIPDEVDISSSMLARKRPSSHEEVWTSMGASEQPHQRSIHSSSSEPHSTARDMSDRHEEAPPTGEQEEDGGAQYATTETTAEEDDS